MQFNNTIIEDELALALYNTRFVSDQFYRRNANNGIMTQLQQINSINNITHGLLFKIRS